MSSDPHDRPEAQPAPQSQPDDDEPELPADEGVDAELGDDPGSGGD